MIKGGYYIKARQIQESEIAHAAPSVREIWDWLLREVNHKDKHGISRGSCVRTYQDIRDGLSWYCGWRKMSYSKHDCENTMKWLTKRTMITTKKTTRGLRISIVNYDVYQNPKNYESHTDDGTTTTRKPQTPATINKNDKNDKKEYIAANAAPMTLDEFVKSMRSSPRRYIRIIGEYADEKKLAYTTKEQWKSFTNRNLRVAKQLEPFTDDQMAGAIKKMYTDRSRMEREGKTYRWGMETLLKYLE
jgi:hypothetical protein